MAALLRRVAIASLSISVLFVAWLALLHLRMVVSPAPQEMREGAAVWITRLLLEGRNPYALGELPESTNVYGILYHLVVWPLARLFGNSFMVHRVVSLASIATSCVLMWRLLKRRGTDAYLTLAGVLLFYVSSLYFVAPLARPDSLGLALSLASITLLSSDPLPTRRFCAGLGLALLALMTKAYFAYPPFIIAAYVFLFRSPRRGLVYGLVTVAAATGLLLLLSLWFPVYVNVSLVSNAHGGYRSASHLAGQTRDWLLFSLPLAIGLLIAASSRARLRAIGTSAPSIFAFATVANAAVFFLWLGWHPGAHMTYLFHLVTPVMIPALLPALGRRDWTRALVTAALPVALALNAHYFPLSLARFSAAETQFAHLNAVVNAHHDVLGSTEIAGLLALGGRPVVDSGQSEYFGAAIVDARMPGLVPAAILEARWDGFLNRLAADIERGRFDLVVRSDRWGLIPDDSLAARYQRIGSVELDFVWSTQRWPVVLWEPAPAGRGGTALP